MNGRIACKIVAWQIQKGYLQEEQRTTYNYAYEILLTKIMNLMIAIIVALIFQAPVIVLTLLATYIPLRTYAGGYHAKKNLHCTMISTAIICCVCAVVKYFPVEYMFMSSLLYSPISAVLIWIYAPVEAVNKPLDAKEIKRYRIKTRILILVGLAVTAYVYKLGYSEIGFTISMAYYVLAMMLIVGRIKVDEEKEKIKYETNQ